MEFSKRFRVLAIGGMKLPNNMKHKALRFKVIAQKAIDWYITIEQRRTKLQRQNATHSQAFVTAYPSLNRGFAPRVDRAADHPEVQLRYSRVNLRAV